MPDLFTLLSSVGVSALLTTALIFLAKNWISERLKGSIKSEYDEKLETHKAQLKALNDTELEHFKAQLYIAASERSIRLTRVFERTVETVAGTYERLLAFQDAVGRYTSMFEWGDGPSKEDRRKIVAAKLADFVEYYMPRRPFLPKPTVRRIDDFCAKLRKITFEFMWGVEKGGDAERRRRGEDKDTWAEADRFMTKEAPPILELLEDDLRKILGTHEETGSVAADRGDH